MTEAQRIGRQTEDVSNEGVLQAGTPLVLKVERATYGPDSIAHAQDGKTVFVQGAVPGDTVEASVYQDGPSFSRAKVTRVLEPSPDRVDSPCPFADVCGGCPWAHVSYEGSSAPSGATWSTRSRGSGTWTATARSRSWRSAWRPGSPGATATRSSSRSASVRGRAVVGMHDASGTGVVKVDRRACCRRASRSSSRPRAARFLHLTPIDRVGIRASKRTGNVEVALWTAPGPFPRAQAARSWATPQAQARSCACSPRVRPRRGA